jgi:hypothetical protein
VPPS